MDTKLYVWCALLGMLGVATQTIIKISSYQKQAKAANIVFNIKDYFANDWGIQALNVITVIVALVTVDELTNRYPQVLPFLKWFFFFIGYTGSSLLNGLLSRTQKTITNVVDIKTNISDNVTEAPVTTMQEANKLKDKTGAVG